MVVLIADCGYIYSGLDLSKDHKDSITAIVFN